ncbi:hypothetical protein UlMin_007522 [Ulmus minor]
MGKGRAPCCDKSQVKRGPWSPAEDLRLITFIQKHGHDNWRALPKQAGLLRCGKSCRLRWINYLRPDVKRGNFSEEEEEAIIKLHATLGNKWSKIASHFPGRTDNEIKNVWNTHLKKKLSVKNTCDPSGDEPKEVSTITSSSSSSSGSILSSGKRSLGQELGDPSEEEESAAKRPRELAQIEQENVPKQATSGDHLSPEAKIDTNEVVKITSSSSASSDVSRPLQNDMDLLFDFEVPCDVNDLLQEVSKPEVLLENLALEEVLPLEADYDFWNILDSFATCSQPNQVQVQVQDSEPAANMPSSKSNGVDQEFSKEIENSNWFRYLETELGLVKDQDNLAMEQLFSCDDLQKKPESAYQMWPSLTQNSAAI